MVVSIMVKRRDKITSGSSIQAMVRLVKSSVSSDARVTVGPAEHLLTELDEIGIERAYKSAKAEIGFCNSTVTPPDEQLASLAAGTYSKDEFLGKSTINTSASRMPAISATARSAYSEANLPFSSSRRGKGDSRRLTTSASQKMSFR
jgi:hypothetical protein